MEFLPAERRTRRLHLGFFRAGEQPRSEDDLGSLLTAAASSEAGKAGEVVAARQLPARVLPEIPPVNTAPYLVPDPGRTESMTNWLAARRRETNSSRPVVGLVWRSELRQMMRTIHYLTLDDLVPLFELDVDFLVLQHDVDHDERRFLDQRLPNRIAPPPDLDLRDDLDGLASLVAALDAVVGVGTTAVEIAGAVGTRTVMIQPTHFGSWRACDASGSDYWYRSVQVATISEAAQRSDCVRTAARLVRQFAGSTPSSQT